ncbi:MAG: ABC transporter permease, partial [Erysipelotrichaceae bacterium]|nr:ABC transporter permease [Erysipelotrichaceae bacterium]
MYFQHYIFISDRCYEESFNEPVHKTVIAVRSNDIASLNRDIGKLEDYTSMIDFSGMIQQFQTIIDALDLIILVIIITSGALAFVVLFNITQVNISERIREIATLKVLGFRTGEVESYIFREIMILSIIGALLGIPLGIIEHHFIMNIINMEMVMFGMNISLFSFTCSFVITIGFTLIVFLFEKRPLREIKMVESLKSVE